MQFSRGSHKKLGISDAAVMLIFCSACHLFVLRVARLSLHSSGLVTEYMLLVRLKKTSVTAKVRSRSGSYIERDLNSSYVIVHAHEIKYTWVLLPSCFDASAHDGLLAVKVDPS